jgi:hypothetical protein
MKKLIIAITILSCFLVHSDAHAGKSCKIGFDPQTENKTTYSLVDIVGGLFIYGKYKTYTDKYRVEGRIRRQRRGPVTYRVYYTVSLAPHHPSLHSPSSTATFYIPEVLPGWGIKETYDFRSGEEPIIRKSHVWFE